LGGLVRLLVAPWPEIRKRRGAQQPKKKEKEMIALKLLLTVAGVLLLAAALGIPLYGLWPHDVETPQGRRRNRAS
jgi:flagellar basal body-associated protein FliL